MLEFALWRRAESLVVTRPAVERGEEKRTMAAAGEGGGGMREEERRRGRAAERSAFEEENETRALIFPSAPLRGKKLQFVFLLLLFQTPANPHAAPLGSFLSLSECARLCRRRRRGTWNRAPFLREIERILE